MRGEIKTRVAASRVAENKSFSCSPFVHLPISLLSLSLAPISSTKEKFSRDQQELTHGSGSILVAWVVRLIIQSL